MMGASKRLAELVVQATALELSQTAKHADQLSTRLSIVPLATCWVRRQSSSLP